jgi:tRNA threonylcarbamoyladenosine modification (KEOPS) complex  Pcc1 subunit
MPKATLRINLGPKARDYVRIVGKGEKYRRGSISFRATNGTIEVKVEANDAVALLASLSSAVKQLRVVGDVGALMK